MTTDPTTAPQPATPGEAIDLDAIEARAAIAAPSRLRTAMGCVPEGQIRQGCILSDGDTIREAVRAAAKIVFKDVPALVGEVRRLRVIAAVNHGLYKSAELDAAPAADPGEAEVSAMYTGIQAVGVLRQAGYPELAEWVADLAGCAADPGVNLPDGIALDLVTWRCSRCDKRSTWTTQGGVVDPLAEAVAEAFGHHANHEQWSAERLSNTPPAGTEGE